MTGTDVCAEAVPATVVVALNGELDGADHDELAAMLEALVVLPQPVWLDVSAARSSSGAALRTLLRFREVRLAAGRSCRLRGLHTEMATKLADADLGEVFALWTDTVHDDPRSTVTVR